MAQITELGSEVSLKWIHNVSYNVGPQAWNKRDDVLLVQHLLNKLLAPLGLTDKNGKLITAYLVRDGICGTNTQTAIWAYQNNVKNVRKLVGSVDGYVDPSNRSGWNNQGNQFTIVHMNRDHRQIYGRLMDDSELPAEVQAALRRGKK
jgi:hypothetical protein